MGGWIKKASKWAKKTVKRNASVAVKWGSGIVAASLTAIIPGAGAALGAGIVAAGQAASKEISKKLNKKKTPIDQSPDTFGEGVALGINQGLNAELQSMGTNYLMSKLPLILGIGVAAYFLFIRK